MVGLKMKNFPFSHTNPPAMRMITTFQSEIISIESLINSAASKKNLNKANPQ